MNRKCPRLVTKYAAFYHSNSHTAEAAAVGSRERGGGKIAFESKEAHVILRAFHVEIY